MIEYGQKLRHYLPALEEKGIGRILVAVNGEAKPRLHKLLAKHRLASAWGATKHDHSRSSEVSTEQRAARREGFAAHLLAAARRRLHRAASVPTGPPIRLSTRWRTRDTCALGPRAEHGTTLSRN